MRAHINDPYVREATRSGYRSRAAYKLIEIAEKDRLLRPGMTVVDLGAAPGSWSQVLARSVGPGGRLIAIDLLPVDPIAGVSMIQGDFREDSALEELKTALRGAQVDLVVSDMSPNLSGVSDADQARSIYLCELALDFACKHLKQNGVFLVKVFQGAGYPEFLGAMRSTFTSVVSRKPAASRDQSSEMYLLGRGLKAGAAALSSADQAGGTQGRAG
jgi:23S rRNA (uridine2552-2'-O)-methyltransferase